MARRKAPSPFLQPVRPMNLQFKSAPTPNLTPPPISVNTTTPKPKGLLDTVGNGLGNFLKSVNNTFNESVGGLGSQAENASNVQQLQDAKKALADYKSGKRNLGDKLNSFLGMPATDYAGQVKTIQGDLQNYQNSLPAKQAEQAKISKSLPGLANTGANLVGGVLGFGGKMALMNQMGGNNLISGTSKIPGSLANSELISGNAAGQALRNTLMSKGAARIAGQAATGASYEGTNATIEGNNNNIGKRMAQGAVEFPLFGEIGGASKGLVKGANPSALREYAGRLVSGGVQGLGFSQADSLLNNGKLATPKEFLPNVVGMGLFHLAGGGKYNSALDQPIGNVKPETLSLPEPKLNKALSAPNISGVLDNTSGNFVGDKAGNIYTSKGTSQPSRLFNGLTNSELKMSGDFYLNKYKQTGDKSSLDAINNINDEIGYRQNNVPTANSYSLKPQYNAVKAEQSLNEAIQQAQNEARHWDVGKPSVAQALAEKYNIPQLLDEYQQATNPPKAGNVLKEKSNLLNWKRVVGVSDVPNVNKIKLPGVLKGKEIPNQIILPKISPKKLNSKINPLSSKLDFQNAPITPELKPLNINTPTDQIKSPLAENMASATAKLNDVPLDVGPLSKKLLPMNLEAFSNYDNKLPDTTKQIVSKTDRSPINVKGIANEAYIKSIDDLYKLNQVDKVAQDVLGRPLKANESMYKLGQNTRNANVIANEIATNQFVGSDLQKIGDGFSSITKQIPKGLDRQFEDYLVHKHAPSWMRLDRKIFPDKLGVTKKVSNLIALNHEKAHPEFKKIAQQFYDFRDKLVQEYLVKPGIISKEAYAAMKEKYPNYVPLRRQMDENTQPLFRGLKRGFANQTDPIKKATGSERPIISPIESTIEDIGRYVNVAKRNEVMQTLIKNMQKDPEAFSGLAEIVKAPKENLLSDINKTLQDEGVDGIVNNYNRQFDEVFSKRKTGGDNTVTGLVGGNKVHVKVNDPQLLEALTNLTPEARGVLVNSVGKITGVMKALTTGVNPVFSLARNIFRDVPTAYMNSPSTNNPIKFGYDLLHSFASTLADTSPNKAKIFIPGLEKLANLHQEYKAAGGGHSSPLSVNRNLLTESKAKALPGYYDIKHPLRTTGRLAKQGLNTIGKLNDAVESAPRMGEFKRIAKPGDYASKVEGIYQANDVTVNFNKRGKWGKEVDAVVPYLNAALQGLDKIGRQFKNDPVKTSAKAFLSVTVPTILLYSINHNNPNYQKLNDYTKDNYFLIPKVDGTFFKIPKPREVGVMFGSSVERALRQWNDNDPKGFENFMETIKTNFAPPTRTIFAPINDLRSNKDFINRPIVPLDLYNNVSPKLQFDEKTSQPSKVIGGLLNVSPKQLDYLAKSYLGVVGQLGIPATSKGATIGETLKRQVTVDPFYSNDILNNFYNRKNQLDTEYNDIMHTKSFNGMSRAKVLKDMQARKIYDKIGGGFSKFRKVINSVQSSNIPEQQKQLKMRQLQDQMQKLAERANKY